MASDWLLQTLYAALIGQTIVPSSPPLPTPSLTRPEVRTLNGDVRGFQTLTTSGTIISTFLGIPFATPPVGKLRFDKPLPARKWSGVRDASKFGNECLQRSFPGFNIQLTDEPIPKSEDCLYLNIYKPELNSSIQRDARNDNLLPVMVWIHGGGFIGGAGSDFDGSILAENGQVIVVTINYRLDIFGFLSNGDDVIPGNYGMLDQVMTLRWVKENIKPFGGDPDKVTIFGQSAGSGSVALLILSPLAKGLFNRAIMESGSSLSPWSHHFPSERVSSKQITSLVGVAVGCNDADAAKKLDCLRNVDAETLFNASLAVSDALGSSIMHKPVPETKFGFLPDQPDKMWARGQYNRVDTIRGFNKAEMGLSPLRVSNFSLNFQQFLDVLKTNLDPTSYLNEDSLIQSALRDYNINNKTDGHEILMRLVTILTDIYFTGPTIVEANMESLMAPGKNHYVYEFDYKSSHSQTPSWMPAVHGEELEFIFGFKWRSLALGTVNPATADDKFILKLVQTMWSNFAKYGSPTGRISSTSAGNANPAIPTWSRYIGDGSASVLRIDVVSREISFINHTSARFFQKVLKKMDTDVSDKFIVG